MSPLPPDLPDDSSLRFVAVLNKKVEQGQLFNALGHMTAGLVGRAAEPDRMCFIDYEDKDGGQHPGISHFPFIVLRADNSNKIRTLRNQAKERDIPFVDFVGTMALDGTAAEYEATGSTPEEQLDYWGICMFGKSEDLKEMTRKFSLFS